MILGRNAYGQTQYQWGPIPYNPPRKLPVGALAIRRRKGLGCGGCKGLGAFFPGGTGDNPFLDFMLAPISLLSDFTEAIASGGVTKEDVASWKVTKGGNREASTTGPTPGPIIPTADTFYYKWFTEGKMPWLGTGRDDDPNTIKTGKTDWLTIGLVAFVVLMALKPKSVTVLGK